MSVREYRSNAFLRTSSRNNNTRNYHNSQLRASDASPRTPNSVLSAPEFEILPSIRNSRFELIISVILGDHERESSLLDTLAAIDTRDRIFRKELAEVWMPAAGLLFRRGKARRYTRCQENKNYSRNRRWTNKTRNNLERSSSCNFVQTPTRRQDVRVSFAEAFLIEFVAEQKFREESSVVSLFPSPARDSRGIL